MLRILRLAFLIGAFAGGYYLGRLPNSPDVFAYAKDAWQKTVTTGEEISAKAKTDGTSVPQAAVAYIKEHAAKQVTTDATQALPGALNSQTGRNF